MLREVHHRGQVWDRDTRSIEEIDRELRELADSTLERYARNLDMAFVSGLQMEHWPVAQRDAMRAQNELARRERVKRQEEEKAAEEAKVQARIDAENQAKIDAYRQQVEARWVGTRESFLEAWPELLRQWQIDQARAGVSGQYDAVRARVKGF